MTDKDDFDRIVEGLDLNLEFPDEVPEPEPVTPAPTWSDDAEPVDEEPFYRKVEPTPLRPRRRGVALAWVALAGAPLLLVIATVMGEILPRPMLVGAVLIFVAAAIYLVSQLPEHGPGRSDWPDDGAVL
ncbi:hypothetical protein GCM10022234_35390 [Aeromicrobium panaciterrae]|uniref:hypothetical protein n=1 Tax=Aeromicrobium panaciterrae TaxID=363861 RepID=UPI0031E0C0EC